MQYSEKEALQHLSRVLSKHQDKYLTNPLMLPNTLNEGNLATDPVERAMFDAGGEQQGSVFDERLRLRKAEYILMKEIEYHTQQSIHQSSASVDSPSPPLRPQASPEEVSLAIDTLAVAKVPPPDMITHGRPPTREGDSRGSRSRGSNPQSGGGMNHSRGGLNPIAQDDIYEAPDEPALNNITFSDIDKVCKIQVPSASLQLAASVIVTLLNDQPQVHYLVIHSFLYENNMYIYYNLNMLQCANSCRMTCHGEPSLICAHLQTYLGS